MITTATTTKEAKHTAPPTVAPTMIPMEIFSLVGGGTMLGGDNTAVGAGPGWALNSMGIFGGGGDGGGEDGCGSGGDGRASN